jgi:hypothetical protein
VEAVVILRCVFCVTDRHLGNGRRRWCPFDAWKGCGDPCGLVVASSLGAKAPRASVPALAVRQQL